MGYRPVVLTIFDGWGVAPDSDGNAITQARTPNFLSYVKNYPVMTLYAAGNEVGINQGEMGNSEVGHLNIGAGRVYYQSCPRINQAISSEEFFTNTAFVEAANHVKKNKSKLHLVGLIGSGNVHASGAHLEALLAFCKKQGLGKEVFVHAILDGRDCVYNSGLSFVQELEKRMAELKVGAIATLSGRYYAMDRDNRWDRIEKSYRAMAEGAGPTAESAEEALRASYSEKRYDEEFVPTVMVHGGKPIATVAEGDAVIYFNFRPDRARELTHSFVLPGFEKFERTYIKNLFFVTMTEYEKDLPVVVAYPPIIVTNCLAEVVSKAGLKQLHVAETEKYAHITFFLNGAVESPFPGEDRVLIPSPQVSSYAEVPEMSVKGIVKEAVKGIDGGTYDFIALNFANPDMVGHTGNREATIAACEAADAAFKEVVEHTLAKGGVVVMTADHGNAEGVINLQTGEIDKEHSTSPVPLLIIGRDFEGQAGPGGDPPDEDLSLLSPVGILADVAPTVLKLMGLPQPPEMTGAPLI
jgi:2,3-bisphosphoglycerate-independent phosphoglycerate mutase